MTKTFYLSFAADDRFLGACVVDVTDEDAARARAGLQHLRMPFDPGHEWIAAASMVARAHACHPRGGEMVSVLIPPDRLDRLPPTLERFRLYSKADLDAMPGGAVKLEDWDANDDRRQNES